MVRIAIVDDEKSCRDILCNYAKEFEKESAEQLSVKEFDNGMDFLEQYKKGKFERVLMDIAMQNMNGLQTAEQNGRAHV